MEQHEQKTGGTFESLGLQPETLKALAKMGFKEPTPVQLQAIPAMMENRDVIAKAPTGTGKTCAFGIPLIDTRHCGISILESTSSGYLPDGTHYRNMTATIDGREYVFDVRGYTER